jgi:hypothetical protein
MPLGNTTVGGTGGFNEIVTLELDDRSIQDVGATLQKVVDFWRNDLSAKKACLRLETSA